MNTGQKDRQDGTREFKENPYTPDNIRFEDVVRIFYAYDLPIIPVVSKRGVLIGILIKKDVISELSDLERAEKYRIDEFITKLAKKMTLDELLPFGNVKNFIVINIFGETQGTWSRLQLFNAIEGPEKHEKTEDEAEKHRQEQVLEWMIYLILEHIPRPLYAVNTKGKTIFYNNYFEDIYKKEAGGEVDPAFIENSFADADRNELLTVRDSDEIYFLNKDLNIFYEKIPMYSKKKKVGFLIFCDKEASRSSTLHLPGIDARGMTLSETMEAIERQIIIEAIKKQGDVSSAADSLSLSKKSLMVKIERHHIDVK
jgi:transcriptional regulator with PAS, ATPase and Fis domain